MKRKLKIGIIGTSGKTINVQLRNIAKEIGGEIARHNCIVLFGFEGDFQSVSTIAAKEAQADSCETIGFLWGGENKDKCKADIAIDTGQLRGGGREFVFIRSCDAVIAIGGGSGTLGEIAIATQHNIPVIVVKKSGGWSDIFAKTPIDAKRKQKAEVANNPKEAVKKAINLARQL